MTPPLPIPLHGPYVAWWIPADPPRVMRPFPTIQRGWELSLQATHFTALTFPC